jgi:hypothetical protein
MHAVPCHPVTETLQSVLRDPFTTALTATFLNATEAGQRERQPRRYATCVANYRLRHTDNILTQTLFCTYKTARQRYEWVAEGAQPWSAVDANYCIEVCSTSVIPGFSTLGTGFTDLTTNRVNKVQTCTSQKVLTDTDKTVVNPTPLTCLRLSNGTYLWKDSNTNTDPLPCVEPCAQTYNIVNPTRSMVIYGANFIKNTPEELSITGLIREQQCFTGSAFDTYTYKDSYGYRRNITCVRDPYGSYQWSYQGVYPPSGCYGGWGAWLTLRI